MEVKSYLQILRHKFLFKWTPFLRPWVYSMFTINEKPIIVLGNQKAGTSAIAALLAKAIDADYDIDIGGFRNREYEALHYKKTNLRSMIEQKGKIEFSKDVVKEPNLTFLIPQLLTAFPEATYVFIMRDPRANIRSTFNRLKIPGTLPDINPKDYPEISPIWHSILYNEWVRDSAEGTHLQHSAQRWCKAAEDYFAYEDKMHLIRYEDFNANKTEAIRDLAERIGRKVEKDIADKVDIQFQVKGSNKKSYEEFFGRDNLRLIESVCSPLMQKFNYQPEIFLHER